MGLGMTLLYIGALHQMVRSNNKAISRLFNELENLHDFSLLQKSDNENTGNKFETLISEIRAHVFESASRYTALGVRIDDLFKLLGKRKDD